MPVKEKYGCQPPLELLRQVIETGGCYDLETKEFKLLNGLVWVSAMLPVKGLTSRLLRHYQLIYVPAFEKDSLVLIFSSIMEWFFTTVEYPFSKELRALSDKIV
jgi:dynein heavy chain